MKTYTKITHTTFIYTADNLRAKLAVNYFYIPSFVVKRT